MDQETFSEDVARKIVTTLVNAGIVPVKQWDYAKELALQALHIQQKERGQMILNHQTIEIGYRIDAGADRPFFQVLIARAVEDMQWGSIAGDDILHQVGATSCKSIGHAEMLCRMHFSGKVKELSFRLHPVLERWKNEHL